MEFTGPGNYKEIEEETEVTFRNQKFTIKHKCYCNEKGEKFTTNRQDEDMQWAVFRAYWERKGFEYFYDIDGYREGQEPANEDLEDAARDYRDKTEFQYPNQLHPAYEGFKAGAQWDREQMMKDAVEATIVENQVGRTGSDLDLLISIPENLGLKDGDKVKVIINKE